MTKILLKSLIFIVFIGLSVIEISTGEVRQGVPELQKTRIHAHALLKAGRYRTAENVLARLRVLYPDDEDIQRKAIWAFEGSQQPQQALFLYDRLLRRHPDDALLSIAAAKCYAWAGRKEKALQLFSEVIRRGRGSDSIKAEYAELLFLDHQYERAVNQYRELCINGKLQRKQAIVFVNALLAQREHSEAAGLLATLAKRYSGDTEVLQATAELAFALKEYERSNALYRELIGKKPETPLFYVRLAGVELAQGNYEQAIKVSNDLLQRFSDNSDALLMIARVSSWQRDYETSLAYYDRLIGSLHSTPDYYREKARVLGWMTSYGSALSAYDNAIQAYPLSNAIKAEAVAKREYYSNAYRHSVKAYKGWLAVEPRHPEALFDLGQLYMRNDRWSVAAATYDTLLAAYPEHRMGLSAREHIKKHSVMLMMRSGAEYFKAESAGRLTDVSYSGFYTNVSAPLHDRVSLSVKLDTKFYHFNETALNPSSRGLTAGLEYHNQPDILLRAASGWRQNSGDLKDSQTGYVEAESSPIDNIHLGFAFRREEVIQNYKTFISHLQTSRWQGRALFDGYRRWNAGADYSLDGYSDGNQLITAGADMTGHLLYDPDRLNVTYRLQNYAFREHRDVYWTPPSFITHTAGIEWRHHLHNAELFQGGNDSYFSTAFHLSLEPGGNMSHQISAGVHHDWNKRLSSSLECQYTWDTTSSIYEDRRLAAELLWFF